MLFSAGMHDRITPFFEPPVLRDLQTEGVIQHDSMFAPPAGVQDECVRC